MSGSMTEEKVIADGLDQLQSLEEKITQTIEALRSTRAEKTELLQETARLRRERELQHETIERLEARLGRMEKEKDTVRVRLQKLLDQVDTLTRERPEA
jgi:FtsZ-binding cell division protein ZapB